MTASAKPPSAATAGAPGPGVDSLYRAHGLDLVRFAVMLVGDRATAEDVVQEAFLGLHRTWLRGVEPANVLAYLRTAVVNAARSALRGRARRQALLLRSARHDPPVWSAEAAAMANEEGRAVLAAIARLPRRQREVLALRYFLDLSEKEIAETLGVSRGTVASTAARALAVLTREFKESQ
jgi:RNA polymerase sigma-70 factor (sigma-E family)